jgi:hypothetical protein
MPCPINANLFRLAVTITNKAFADIPEEQMRVQPAPSMNPPVWILGHLCVSLDGALRLIGQKPVCPPDYRKYFGPGSKLEALPPELPTKQEMLANLGQITECLLAELPKVPEAYWTKPNPSKFMTAELPTVLDIVSHLLFTHQMMHVGQLTVWRRLAGLPSLIQI